MTQEIPEEKPSRRQAISQKFRNFP